MSQRRVIGARRMLLIVLALFWVALLAPVAIRRFRDGGAETSIQSFHAEHEVLSRQEYAVAPAHRLDEPDEDVVLRAPGRAPSAPARRSQRRHTAHAGGAHPRGTSGPRTTTYDEPSESCRGDHESLRARRTRRVRSEPEVLMQRYEPPIRRRTMKQQRRVMFTGLVGAPRLMTAIAVRIGCVTDSSISRRSRGSRVVLFVALALYAVSQGYLNESSLQRAPAATSRSREWTPIAMTSTKSTRASTSTTTRSRVRVRRSRRHESWHREPSLVAP